ncbi:pyruvate kinase [Gonapodya prolifera JEL478]|uniref:Pyruvate kinase n=1 Tax=Gonapodya prolifera (strain JEL478) TaxID=1344416 RepID=A0A139ATY6_GONPJ|nr:pyruvate kinase [Gonapodya prolifera JEL478]|eukprot:KXS20159.1 pyruvate kinase [Gonapodya prolifera JEL478]
MIRNTTADINQAIAKLNELAEKPDVDRKARLHPAFYGEAPNLTKTKIVATIGPASASKEAIAQFVNLGVSVFRLNMSHCTHEFALQVIKDLRSYLEETELTAEVGIWVDINGPKVRTGKLKGDKPVQLIAGQDFYVINDENYEGDEKGVATTYTKKLVEIGDKIIVDDGLIALNVVERVPEGVRCIVENSGLLGPHKGINFPSHVIEELPAVSDKDAQDLKFALDNQADFVSVSCIRNLDDVQEVRLLLGNSRTKLLSKIENERSLENFEAILKISDGIVIDRGYLGAEVDVEYVTSAQKQVIAMANTAGKPVLVSNQMLESMKDHPRPSRSEAADVANAVLDGADGLILSAETAIGKFMIEAVTTMRRISWHAEKGNNYVEWQAKLMRTIPKPIGISESIASSAVLCARQVGAACIIAVTEFGGTARLISKYRPSIPIIVATLIRQTARQMGVSFGIVPYYHPGSPETILYETVRFIVELGLAKPGDIVVVTSGQNIGFLEGTTTKMQVLNVPHFA